MRNIYREKHGLTRKRVLLPGLLLLSNKKQTEVIWEKEGRAIIYEKKKNYKSRIFDKKSKRTEQTSFVRQVSEKVSDIRFICNINYT